MPPRPVILGGGGGGGREGDCRATDLPELIPSGGVCRGAGIVRRPPIPPRTWFLQQHGVLASPPRLNNNASPATSGPRGGESGIRPEQTRAADIRTNNIIYNTRCLRTYFNTSAPRMLYFLFFFCFYVHISRRRIAIHSIIRGRHFRVRRLITNLFDIANVCSSIQILGFLTMDINRANFAKIKLESMITK